MFEATLSIDLGASYTKVAYRPTCIPENLGTIQEEAKVLMIDNSPLIPSLAIQSHSGTQQWFFGRIAAGMKPNHQMQVFQNWKANLFGAQNDKDSAKSVIIAHRFFEWLRMKLESMGIDVTHCQTRIAMPAFDTFDENANLLARCMDLSGWNNPMLILKVREPHANAIGLFTKGKNAVMRNGIGRIAPNYGAMFEQANPYLQAERRFPLAGGNLFTVMVVDIGAFTTDLAKLTFDFTTSADGLQMIRQESYALGVINDLDKPLFQAIGQSHGFSWNGHSFFETEDCKRNLYQNLAYPLQTNVKGSLVTLELGTEEDQKLITSSTQQFAADVWDKIAVFSKNEVPSHLYITGGGSLIKEVAEKLRASIIGSGMRLVSIDNGEGANGTEALRSWSHTGENLQRLATAIGGASVIFQEAAAPIQQCWTGLQDRLIAQAPIGYKTCRCHGGNKDCCFCNGRGFC